MATGAAKDVGGFWRGFGLGLIVAVVGLLGVMIAFPPVPLAPPEIDPAISGGPGAPEAPEIAPTPPDAPVDPLGPSAPAPLVGTQDATASPPSLAPIAPGQTDGPGSPSLVPSGD